MEKLHRPAPGFDLNHEASDFVDRVCRLVGSKEAASQLDRGYTAVRSWTGDAERIPLVKLPELQRMADPDDPFLGRLMALMGYRLIPLDPSPEQVAAILAEHGLLKKGTLRRAATVLRGIKRDPRQRALPEMG